MAFTAAGTQSPLLVVSRRAGENLGLRGRSGCAPLAVLPVRLFLQSCTSVLSNSVNSDRKAANGPSQKADLSLVSRGSTLARLFFSQPSQPRFAPLRSASLHSDGGTVHLFRLGPSSRQGASNAAAAVGIMSSVLPGSLRGSFREAAETQRATAIIR